MSTTPTSLRTNIVALDGFRGLAIGLVLLYHGFTYERFGGGVGHYIDSVRQIGWVGVDVFFVMSGFLITGILLESRGRPRYWRDFIIRRGLRIFPLYYAVLTLIAIGSLVFPDLGKAGVATIWVNFAYLTNFWIAHYGENHVPLDIAWSLAIEEQFYLVYPVIVSVCNRVTLAKVLVGVIIAAPLLRLLTFEYGAQPQLGPYVLPYCRMDSLAIGALVRLAYDSPRRNVIESFARWAPLACILALAILLTWPRGEVIRDVRYVVIGYTVTAVAAATLLARIMLAANDAPVRRAFEWSPLVYLGKISYCVYLIHLIARTIVAKPLAQVLTPGSLAFCTAQLVLMTALTVIGATVSYHYFERPILALKDRWAPIRRQGSAAHPL